MSLQYFEGKKIFLMQYGPPMILGLRSLVYYDCFANIFGKNGLAI